MDETEAVQVYKSKVGIKIVLLLATPLGTVAFLASFEKNGPVVIVVLLAAVLAAYLLTAIRYIIREGSLYIHCGGFFSRKISIQDIRRVIPTRTWLAAPAASLDRINLERKFGHVIISPEKKSDFIYQLTNINPDIQPATVF